MCSHYLLLFVFFLSYANVRKVCPEVCTFLCYVRPLGQDRGTSHFSGNFLGGEESVLVYYQRGKKNRCFQNKKQENDKKGRKYLIYLKELVRELNKILHRERVLKNKVSYQCKIL